MKKLVKLMQTSATLVEAIIPVIFARETLQATRLNSLVCQIDNAFEWEAMSGTGSAVATIELLAVNKSGSEVVLSNCTWWTIGGVAGSTSMEVFKHGYELEDTTIVPSGEIIVRLNSTGLIKQLCVNVYVDYETVKLKEADFNALGYNMNEVVYLDAQDHA
jgi:aspartate/tyrosine/aromatic aminotransferase